MSSNLTWWKAPNGKPLRKINAITQDPHGYMWFLGQDEKIPVEHIAGYPGIGVQVQRKA